MNASRIENTPFFLRRHPYSISRKGSLGKASLWTPKSGFPRIKELNKRRVVGCAALVWGQARLRTISLKMRPRCS